MWSAAKFEGFAPSPIAAMLILVALPVLITIPVAAAPLVPTDDNQILESGLPTTDPRVPQMRALTGALKEHPDNLAVAMRMAGRHLAMGVAEADPRFVGYARGTLARWWADDHAAPALRIPRAHILQAQHDFIPAAAQPVIDWLAATPLEDKKLDRMIERLAAKG